ncbi:MAG: UDP-N-acetylglucosamine pyrophosphorylase [Spirochaetota bacterium]
MASSDFSPDTFLDLSATIASPLFSGLESVWDAIPLIAAFVGSLLARPPEGYERVSEHVIAHREALISPRAELRGPAVIGKGAEIGPGAWLRASVIVGNFAVVGNSSELKNCILFDGALAPHFNYVGDSIMGRSSHLGAGAILSNQRSDKGEVFVRSRDGTPIATGLLKFGAILGDRVEVGCNAVCFPGSLVGRDATIYPLTPIRGFIPASSIVKQGGAIVSKSEGSSRGR